MGQKIHPVGFRLGVVKDWDSKWYANKREYGDLLHEDLEVKALIKERFFQAGISRIEIERAANRAKITIHTGRPGMVIGRGGSEVDKLRKDLEARTGRQIQINIVEVKTPEIDAQLVAENIAFALERRISFRRAMRQAQQRAVRLGVEGIKVSVSGRLGGAEIARTEWNPEGSIPLHTLRADIDYGFAEANTTFGKIGVKVWVYHGEILPDPVDEKKAEGGE
ncbi:MAG: 30S ribosomal protein S3 [Firmicutes bacterium]|nr:30S ribosomal protein S3 [Bacillota bacterium]